MELLYSVTIKLQDIWSEYIDARTIAYEIIKDVTEDLAETADKDYNDDDISLAIQRVLFKRICGNK